MKTDFFNVKDKTVIITGGLGQLGWNFSSYLLTLDSKVAIFDKSLVTPQRKADLAEYSEDKLMVLNVDVTNSSSIQAAVQIVTNKWGAPDALINNAAIDSPPGAPATENGPFEFYPEESWNKVMDANVKGVFLCSQVIGSIMAEAKGGSIINISSIYGLVSPNQEIYEYRRKRGEDFYKPIAYSASKSAILNMTRYMATYWAKKRVRVNTLTLAGVFNNQDEQFLEEYYRRMPIGRMAREDEYNGAIVFLISEASSYMTGSNLIIDGGWTAW